MRHSVHLVPLSLVLASTVACGSGSSVQPGPSDITEISLEAAIPKEYEAATEGVAVDRRSGHLFVLNQAVGVIELDQDGGWVQTFKNGEFELNTSGMTDIALLADGRFVLASNGDTFLYDPVAKTQISFFCLVPAFQESWLENGAVTVDEEGERILAAPAYFSGGEGPDTAWHVAYSAVNGEFISQVDVRPSNFIAHGLAFDRARNRVLGVKDNRLAIFATTGTLIRTLSLEVSAASGITLDEATGQVYVAQRNQRALKLFNLSAM